MLEQIAFRFAIGGLVVSAFALIADILKPKTFAGVFGAAPSVALATLALAALTEGKTYAAAEARSMIGGAAGLFVYSAATSWLMMRYKMPALQSSLVLVPVWFGVAFGCWFLLLR